MLCRSYSYSAVGLNYVASAFVILFAIFCVGLAQQDVWKGATKKIQLDLPLLIDSNFCAGAAMIRHVFGQSPGMPMPGFLAASSMVIEDSKKMDVSFLHLHKSCLP